MTGNVGLHNRGWEPMDARDMSIADILRRHGYICGLISDTYHYRAPGMNYHHGFHAYEWIRGQEYDPWVSAVPRRRVGDYVNEHYPDVWKRRVAQYLANTERFTKPEDWFAPQVVDTAVGWLKENRAHKQVFLWIDSFDPHEPWDPPADFDRYRPGGYAGPRLILPMGGEARTWATPQQVDQIRGLYAGEVSFVDHTLGKLFAALDDYGYTKDSIIFLLADHGHPLADHGKFLKGGDRTYNELLKVPFLVRMPGGMRNRHTDALICFPDVVPTILDLLGMTKDCQIMTGRSFRPLLEGRGTEHRETVVMGYHDMDHNPIDRCVRDKRWSYIRRPTGVAHELYDLVEDPKERSNQMTVNPAPAQALLERTSELFFQEEHPSKGLQGKYEMASGAIE